MEDEIHVPVVLEKELQPEEQPEEQPLLPRWREALMTHFQAYRSTGKACARTRRSVNIGWLKSFLRPAVGSYLQMFHLFIELLQLLQQLVISFLLDDANLRLSDINNPYQYAQHIDDLSWAARECSPDLWTTIAQPAVVASPRKSSG